MGGELGTPDSTHFFLVSICTETGIPPSPPSASPTKGRVKDLLPHRSTHVLQFPEMTKGGDVILQISTNAVTLAPAPMGDASTPPAPTLA